MQKTWPVPDKRSFLFITGFYIFFLFIYGHSLCPGIGSGDSPEFVVSGSTFGIPHPPGYPLYTLLSNILCVLIPFGNAATRINFFSAICASITVCEITFLILLLTGNIAGSIFTGFCTGFGLTFWSQSIIAEVYTLDAALLGGVMVLLVKAKKMDDIRQNFSHILILAIILYGLACGHRNVNIIFFPIIVFAVYRLTKTFPSTRITWIKLILILCSTFVIYAYIPIASHYNPSVDTLNVKTFAAFKEMVTASVYQKYFQSLNKISLGNHLTRLIQTLPEQIGFMLVFIPVGIWWLMKNRKFLIQILSIAICADGIFICYYRIPDAQVLLIPLILFIAVIGGTGAAFFCQSAIKHSSRYGLLTRTILLLLGLTLGLSNFASVNQHDNRIVEQFCKDALSIVRQNAVVLLLNVDTVTHGMMYIQDKELYRTDLLVIAKGRGARWYQEQIHRKKPELNLPIYDGQNSFDQWPAMVLEKYYDGPGVYLTAPVQGYFQYPLGARLNSKYASIPSGFLFKAVSRSTSVSGTETEEIVNRNKKFWSYAWVTLNNISRYPDDADVMALILNYATYREIFAEFAASHGYWDAAMASSTAVINMNPEPLLQKLNAIYRPQGKRYVMSDMVNRARTILIRKLPQPPML
ncbi:MAG: hypothetical protein A2161_04075 [Candidatus Schekmanbacteria bacterium RBG_13_48_7]|uniref:DUF2723 domain-containing protein n=1 Tax=Candidatus Schekmanbacteria bacterium RBG_13_48_7 TaxID=1817878 RepID=A0A1F7RM01_9BACT|nr:MAG: hypothetical protein A2161_04075 [Candidatus Schekmanbacteria bacterium RBG_13_48_7]